MNKILLHMAVLFASISCTLRAEVEFGNGFGVSNWDGSIFQDDVDLWGGFSEKGGIGGGGAGFGSGGSFRALGNSVSHDSSHPEKDLPAEFASQRPKDAWKGIPDLDFPDTRFEPPFHHEPLFGGGNSYPGEFDIPHFHGNGPPSGNERFVTNDLPQLTVTPVPEPATYGLISSTILAGLVIWRSRRSKTVSIC